jgi:hypothetical protein
MAFVEDIYLYDLHSTSHTPPTQHFQLSTSNSALPTQHFQLSTSNRMRSQLLLLFVAACPLIQGAKLRILLSNDDGWAENSVRELYDTLSPIGDIALVAPGRDRSNDGW